MGHDLMQRNGTTLSDRDALEDVPIPWMRGGVSRRDEEIVVSAASAVSSLGPCRAEAVYLAQDGRLVALSNGPRSATSSLVTQLDKLIGLEGAVALSERPWAWAYPLYNDSKLMGYLVVGADAEPPEESRYLLSGLALRTAMVLAEAGEMRAEEHLVDELRLSNRELTDQLTRFEELNTELTDAVAELRGQVRIREEFVKVLAGGDGEDAIAELVYKMTNLPVAVEDRFGYLRAWAGPGRPDQYPRPNARRRAEILRQAERAPHAIRSKDRIIALAQSHGEVLGVLALVDASHRAGRGATYVIERGAEALALELAHQQSLAEAELRLRRDLVDDLINGTDDESAFARSDAVGHDLRRPHCVAVVQWHDQTADNAVAAAVDRSAARLAMPYLSARRSGMVVLLVDGRPQGEALYAAVSAELDSANGAIGIGRRCETPREFPRSFREAVRALRVRQMSRTPFGVTAFDELGIYRILGTGEGAREVERFVWEWLGPLVDYDTRRHSDLVGTLSRYLECGGNYDTTAAALVIHRSTLRYRLQRIREITGRDLSDVDARFNLHVATRAWKILQGTS
jgi:sugar diacid utilization regulator